MNLCSRVVAFAPHHQHTAPAGDLYGSNSSPDTIRSSHVQSFVTARCYPSLSSTTTKSRLFAVTTTVVSGQVVKRGSWSRGPAPTMASQLACDLTPPTLVPAVIPSAVDPPNGERAVARGATFVLGQSVTAQTWRPGRRSARLVPGRRQTGWQAPLLDHPGAGAPPPEARVPVKLHVHSRATTTLTRASRPARERSGAGASASRRDRGGASGPSGPA